MCRVCGLKKAVGQSQQVVYIRYSLCCGVSSYGKLERQTGSSDSLMIGFGKCRMQEDPLLWFNVPEKCLEGLAPPAVPGHAGNPGQECSSKPAEYPCLLVSPAEAL